MTPKTEQGLLIPIPSSWLAVESGVKVLCVFKGRNSCTVDCQGVWLFYGTWNCNFQSSDTSDQECRFWRTLAIHLSYVVAVSEDSAKIRLHVQQYGCVPPPIFIVTISLLQVALFVHYLIESNEPLTWMTSCAGCFVRNNRESSMIFDSGFANEIWRFGSYFLIHQGLQHLLFNLITQIALVCPLEIVHKMWRIGPLYFSGVIYSE
ncbi:hypothetical protein M514_11656 [Trichuris suis]|uniref:Peptidase S54 rhomboid domain-containing protein n=1 Tax=Trichuris suis TaxID=68888 RepID=A0A085MT10_9BILA|nr:hypothetical protein M513_11656 [Trichuris suis]KFD60356.1 hypothetical protein M514_11656 [Trichuris suis]